MTRAFLLAGMVALLALTGCAPMGNMFQRGPRPDANVEGLYSRALTMLEPGHGAAALDSAAQMLDAYLAHAGYVTRRPEALILRRLTGDAIQLSRVAAALQQERAANADTKSKTTEPSAARDSDSLKEIQRLKDELAAANAELERIRKRLATQKP